MIVGYLDFTPETLGYKSEIKKIYMIDVPLSFAGISYRCTCVEFLGKVYCVMPFRRVTGELAISMANKVENAQYFTRSVNTIIAQIVDRHNMIVEYQQGFEASMESIDIREIACAAVGAMSRMGYIEKDVNVDYRGTYYKVKMDQKDKVVC
ncbi:MAG: hypothetical protein J6J16_08680 [Lachnospiraceae bacterium]|nr:hypothetical protein [Lachnospiraceae bacterium]